MRIEYACVCGSRIVVTRRDRRPLGELAPIWTQHAQCPALWARWGNIGQDADTVVVPPLFDQMPPQDDDPTAEVKP